MRDGVGRFQNVLVLGGGSEIARAIVERLLEDGPVRVILASREPVDSAPLESAGATVDTVRFDARDTGSHEAVLAPLFIERDIDLVVLAFGVLGDQEQAERDPAHAVDVLTTNLIGAVSALTVVAARLQAQGHGVILVLSSVAGQRARRSNYVYGASKAGLDAFAQGLRLALAPAGVGVTIVRPGFVHTRMTEGLDPPPLSVDADAVGRAAVSALRAGDAVVWVPKAMRIVAALLRIVPDRVVSRM